MQPPVLFVELASVAVLSLFVVMGLKSGRLGKNKLDMLWVGLASWIAEATCIGIYGFYQYDAPWAVFVGPMPLLVAIIWPVVVFSARALAESFGFDKRHQVALVVFAIVLYDASLVEPVAAASRIWSWNEATFFSVPIIGVVGWAIFAASSSWLLDVLPSRRRWLTVVLAPIATHAGLLSAWWALFRWTLRAPVSDEAAIAGSILVALGLSVIVRKRGLSAPLEVMLPRAAAALLFFTLAGLSGFANVSLILFALPFSVPYLLATRFALGRQEADARAMISACASDARSSSSV